VRKTFQNMPKLTKKGKDVLNQKLIISRSYCIMRRSGNPESLSSNPQAAGSRPAGRALAIKGLADYG